MLTFQQLDVYQCAVEFLAFAQATVSRPARRHAYLMDQLGRAARSILLNIARAAGRDRAADAAGKYAAALGSSIRCAAILDVLHVLKIIDGEHRRQGNELLARIASMLTRLSE